MKNFRFILAAFLTVFYIAAFPQQFGYWMLNNNNPGPNGSNAAVNKLHFQEGSDPVLISYENTYNFEEPNTQHLGCINSAGAYTFNGGELRFFVANNGLYHISDPDNRVYNLLNTNNDFAEIHIINCFEDDNNFLIYSIHSNESAQDDFWDFHETKVNVDADEIISIENKIITMGAMSHTSTAITDWDNDEERTFYISTKTIGLVQFTIEADGLDLNSEDVLISPNELVDDDYFNAYNMELKSIVGEDGYIAWISMHGDGNFLFICEQDGDDLEVIDLEMGRLAGIEFSPIDDEIIYVSYESASNEGILKYNFITQQIVSYIVTGDYGNTFLQTAPDGNIYAVPDDGFSLARINMTTETFEEDIVTFVSNNYIYTYYLDDSDVKYYTLPENSQTWTVLSATVEIVDVSCPGGSDGSATVYPVGGSGSYSYVWYESDCTTPLIPAEIEQSINGYPEGTYCCIVTDVITLQTFEILAVIDVGYIFSHPDFMEVISTTGQSWNNVNYSFEIGLSITNNSTLTINNSTLEFAPEAKVIIEPGSKLIINKSTLTDLTDCPAMWKGVEVWGDESTHQYDLGSGYLQGYIEIQNESIIEHALIGVRLYQPNGSGGYISSTTGGIIKAYDSDFLNNQVSIDYREYSNYYPSGGNPETPNVGYFEDCSFDINSGYLGGSWWFEHVYMAQINGVTFRDSDFTNTFTSQPSGHGINAYASGFHVLGSCSSQTHPCPPQYLTYTNFSNFSKAINLLYSGSYTLDCQYVNFVNNGIGVRLKSVDNAAILFSNFEIGYLAGFQCPLARNANYGIDMDVGCTGFAIEENYFTKAAGMPSSAYIGIRIRESNTFSDLIYKNTFYGLSYANFAEGMNRFDPNFDYQGLEFRCNNNSNNAIDFIVAKKDPFDFPQIRTYQGMLDMEAGNTFSANPKQDGHFKNDGEQHITYYYESNPPIYYTPIKFLPHYITFANTCPSHYSGGGIGLLLNPEQQQVAELEFVTNLENFNNVKSLFDNLKDGGDTESLQYEVETSWPQDMWELRADLLGKSPHLSKEVLMIAADKTDVLPESVLFEILSANPDELGKEELISYLENKEQPLPAYMISILRQLSGEITYKTILLQDMAKYQSNAYQSAYELIRSTLNAEELDYDYLRNWLDNLNNLNADYQIVLSYLAQGDYTNAQAMLDVIPAYHNLQDDELNDFIAYESFIQMQINWKQDGRDIFDLTEYELNTLFNYAENDNGKATVAAQSILEFAYGYDYCNCLPLEDEENFKSTSNDSFEQLTVNALSIEANPNPASTWVTFDYQLPSYTGEASIKITDMTGKTIQTFYLSPPIRQQLWDIRNIHKGVYLYTLQMGGASKSGKLIIE